MFRHLRNVRGFFSDYYLGSVFGRGEGRGRRKSLSDRDTDRAYERFRRLWERADGRADDAALCRERFVRPFLFDVLGLHLGAGDDLVHPLYASAESEAASERPLAAAYCGSWDHDFDAGHGKARRKVDSFLAQRDLDRGLLVSGERLRLVRASGEGPAGSFLEVDLEGLATEDDPESFAALLRLLKADQLVRGEDGRRGIDRVEEESRRHAEKVSEDLKRAVFASAETLVGALLSDAAARGEVEDLAAVSDDTLRTYRDAALTALYRILFILYAEARDPRLAEHRLYRDSYALSEVVEELLREPFRLWPDNRFTLGQRLRALFRLYDAGLPKSADWDYIPPRGGHFFASDTPEGRLLARAALSDRTVARLLLDIATTAPRTGVGRERVSFRELDIESLGSVYEGLLEFEPRVAKETTLAVRVQGRTFALPPEDLVRLCGEKRLALAGAFADVAGTLAEALHPDAPPEADDVDAEDEDDDEESEDAAEADAGDAAEDDGAKGLKKGGTARVLRRLDPGTFHFVPGPARKGSGSFYTPQELVDDLVRHALGPQTEGKDAAGIEALRVLDPACGSAHFLVGAMRFLGQRLHRAYVEEHGSAGPPHFRGTLGAGWDAAWQASDEEARASGSEARAWCKRRIAERCLFGVDLNPTAVHLARVALWIESLAGDRPLTFFEHHVRCGNSLLGTWLDRLEVPPLPSIPHTAGGTTGLFADLVRKAIAEAARLRKLIDADPEALRREGIDPESVAELAFKEHQQRKADALLAAARLLFDLRSASAFHPEIWGEWRALCGLVDDAGELERYARSRPWWERFEEIRRRERFFHWDLEFPEVLRESNARGFDAVLGNPPWDKVLPTKTEFYARADVLIRAFQGNELDRRIKELHAADPGLEARFNEYQSRTKTAAEVLRKSEDFPLSEARSQAAHEDVSKYFVDRAIRLAGESGSVGLIVPSVLYNGDGCVGIRRFLISEARIERFYGFENRRTPKIFPIHSSYKFVNLCVRKGSRAPEFEAAFMRHDPEELASDGPKPWTVRISATEIERYSPETFAFLEYRSPRDQEIARKMHEGRPTLGGDGSGSWGADLISWRRHLVTFNATEDRDLWTNPSTGALITPEAVLGTVPKEPSELLAAMRARGYWPVYGGKHVSQFLVGIKGTSLWLSAEAAERKHGKAPLEEPVVLFRETARNTDERTCFAAVPPAKSAAVHTLLGMRCDHVDPIVASVVLNSLAFDWLLRLRVAGTHVSFTYMRPMPVPPADVVNRLPRVHTQLTWGTGRTHITDDRSLWPLLWGANRAVAEAYALDPDDFEHILGYFPVMARERKEFFAYLQSRLAEWKEGR